MKKLIAVILALATVLALCACGSTSTNKTGADKEATEDKKPSAAAMSTTSANTLGNVEYTLTNMFTSTDVMPPNPSSVYTHYEAESGKIYVVAEMNVKNTGTDSVGADDMMAVKLTINGADYNGNCVVLEDGGVGFNYANITSIPALGTAIFYYMFAVPENTPTDNMEITATVGEENQSATVSLAQFESSIKVLAKGNVVTDDATLSLTLEDVYFSTTLYPPNAGGYYRYYEAESGKTYLIVKLNVKNLKGTDLKYDTIAGVNCEYNGKYKYKSFGVLEEDGGKSLNGYPSQYSIAPLDTGIIYYLMEVPAEVENGPVTVSLYIAGKYYKYNVG